MTPRQAEKELQRQTVLFEERCRSGRAAGGGIKLTEFAERWFELYAEKQLKLRTVARYRELFERIARELGHLRLENIRPQHLLDFYALLEKEPRGDMRFRAEGLSRALEKAGISAEELAALAGVSEKTVQSCAAGGAVARDSADKISAVLGAGLFRPSDDKRGLSPKTIQAHHRLLSSMLGTAVRWQMLDSNPCALVKPPRAPNREAEFLDGEQTAALVRALAGAPIKYRTIVMLLLYTGMRRGELCGLDWRDIDFTRRLVRISKSSLYLAGRGVFEDSPKTKGSARVIRIPEDMLELLRRYRRDTGGAEGRVFTSEDGSPIPPDSVSRWFHNFARKNGLPGVHLHSLRHTNATLLIAAGTNLRTVSGRLGHAAMSTTGNIYAHAVRAADDLAADTLARILKSPI